MHTDQLCPVSWRRARRCPGRAPPGVGTPVGARLPPCTAAAAARCLLLGHSLPACPPPRHAHRRGAPQRPARGERGVRGVSRQSRDLREWGAAEIARQGQEGRNAWLEEWSQRKHDPERSGGGEGAPGRGGSRRPGVEVRRGECGRRAQGHAGSGVGASPSQRSAPGAAAAQRLASRGTHLRAGRPGSAARGLGSQRPRLCGLRWAPGEAEPRRRRCTAAFRFLSRRRPAARAQPCEPGAAASQEQRALPAPPRARPTCSGGRGPTGVPLNSSPPRSHTPETHTEACAVTLLHTVQGMTPPTHIHPHTHTHTLHRGAQPSDPLFWADTHTINTRPRD